MGRDIQNDIRDSRILGGRYEIKYLISESQAAAIIQFIRPYVRLDRYCKTQPDGLYPVVSLYLDSEDLCLCRQSMEGQKNRFKLRIRSYTNEQDYPCFFEIKRRMNTIIIKDRARVLPEKAEQLISGRLPPLRLNDSERQSLEQFLLYMTSLNAKPTVRTRYQRRAFESTLDNRVRITFDHHLSYNATSGFQTGLDGQGWHRVPMNSVVLEIKFTGCYPAWLGRMVKCFNLRQQSVSKYVYSVKRACLSGLLIA